MKKALSVLLAALFACSLLGGCAPIGEWFRSPVYERAEEGELLEVQPFTDKTESEQAVTLYYRFGSTAYLADCLQAVTVKANERVEKVVIQALIDGPSGTDSQEMVSPFPADTRVVSVSDNGTVLFVTLSKEFLSVPAGTPGDWQNDRAAAEAIYTARRLSVQALVCTVTEMGKYSRVQILVDKADSGEGQRISRGEAGFTDGDTQAVLGLQSREAAAVLDPQTVMALVLEAYSRGDWETLYGFLAAYDTYGSAKPAQAEMAEAFGSLQTALMAYTISEVHISADGQRAVVMIDYEGKTQAGEELTFTAIPMRLVRENGIWRVTYSAVEKLFL